MSVVYILVFAAILMAGGFLVAFIWSVKSGQYDDTYTPSVRILFDDAVKESGEQKLETGDGKTETEAKSMGQGASSENSRSVQSQLAGSRKTGKRSVEK